MEPSCGHFGRPGTILASSFTSLCPFGLVLGSSWGRFGVHGGLFGAISTLEMWSAACGRRPVNPPPKALSLRSSVLNLSSQMNSRTPNPPPKSCPQPPACRRPFTSTYLNVPLRTLMHLFTRHERSWKPTYPVLDLNLALLDLNLALLGSS